MKASLHARLALASLVALVLAAPAARSQLVSESPEGVMRPSYALLRATLAARSSALQTSVAYDSQFVGHSHTDRSAGGLNPWNVYVGTCRPNTNRADNALWDFDSQSGLGTPDSLQGWWPIRMQYRYAPISTMTDDQRPWGCIDQGNQLNARPIMTRGRTFGIVSVWHADPGNAVGHVMWTPISGAKSMWCGLRELNDVSVIDPVTHQPYNETVADKYVGAVPSGEASFRCYPGYGNQWDQMLYRDFVASYGQPMTVGFLYRTRMSTTISTGVTTRAGWFHGDPLSMSAGNFISSNAAGANAPRDSFSVYVGVPVDDDAVVLSDPNVTGPVFDRQRRWFNEVLRLDAPRFEILGVAGARPADTLEAAASYAATIPWADPGNGDACVSAIWNAPGNASHLVRLVFRVKTDRTYSDEDYSAPSGVTGGGYTSNGRGAVLLDDVVVNGATSGFEGTNGGVDNALDGAGHWVTPPTDCWKATGKPVPAYVHPVDITTEAHWTDLCGNPHSPTSECDLDGIVASIGNADQNEAIADSRWPAFTESIHGLLSPTINLCTPSSGANAQGLTAAITPGSDDYSIFYELNFAAFVQANTGTLWNFGVQVYPAVARNGHPMWSNVIPSPFRLYQGFPGCQPDLEPIKVNSLLAVTSNPNGIPDSLRLYLGITSECFYFGGTCNSTDGGYFDDIALVITNTSGTDPVGRVTADIWQWFNDAFPVNGLVTDNVPAGSAAFDTTTAYVKGAINTASSTGDLFRFDVLADSIVVVAPNGYGGDPTVRVDLVFRILPGPGNYRADHSRTSPPTSAMTLLRVPTDQAAAATPGDASFWGQYMQTPGAFASPGAHHGGTRWDYLAWNSARCDTVETNLFPVVGRASSGVPPHGGFYQSTYHESDPHFATLGIAKGRCFLIDPEGVANSTNLSCDPAWNAANLTWPLAPGTGFDGAWTTKEYTKIIPDGLLTPGSHVQYFFRKSRIDLAGGFRMVPDTTTISPQRDEANFDGHRWQTFGVLPDRWKAPEFGGSGMACFLVIDDADRRGDGRVWASMCDSMMCGTAWAKWGAATGWHAMGAGFSLDAASNPSIAQAYVQGKNLQPGTLWDLYVVKASESGLTIGTRIGNRYANAPTGLMTGKGAAIGPRKDWLRHYYHGVLWLTGDGNTNDVGPVNNAGEDDIGVIEDFVSAPDGTVQPRSLVVQGSGFAEQENDDGGAHLDFLNNYLFAGLVDASYTNLTPSLFACPDLFDPNAFIVTDGTVYGVHNDCSTLNDVIDVNGPARVVADYENVGVNGPYHASVEHRADVTYNWNSILMGWDIQDGFSRHCATSNGRLSFNYKTMIHAFGSLCSSWGGLCATSGVPDAVQSAPAVDFARIGNSVAIGGHATVRFGVAHAGNVRVTLFDLAGRRVRTLADRAYAAGEHVEPWDGRDDAGHDVRHGVYFARIEFADGTRINGRVIVLR